MLEAKRVDKKKKDDSKEAIKKEDKKYSFIKINSLDSIYE